MDVKAYYSKISIQVKHNKVYKHQNIVKNKITHPDTPDKARAFTPNITQDRPQNAIKTTSSGDDNQIKINSVFVLLDYVILCVYYVTQQYYSPCQVILPQLQTNSNLIVTKVKTTMILTDM